MANSDPIGFAAFRVGVRIAASYTNDVNWDNFLGDLADWFEQRNLFTRDASWVVGVSGGPDSTLLLNALAQLSTNKNLGWRLHIAHLHHGMRGDEADADAQFVQQLGESLGLPVMSERQDIRAHVEQKGGSTEEVARQYRYEFLERVALRTGSELVAVGHHADDNAETILHRILRGTGLRGLAGMSDARPIQPGSRIRLIRPLLGQRRERLETLCNERGLKYRIDSTNLTREFTRGRIRNELLPLLRETMNPNVSEALLRLGDQARWLGTYLEDAAGRTFDSLVVSETPDRLVLNTTALLSKQRIIQAEVVRRAVSIVLGREQDLSYANIESVLRLAAAMHSGKEIHVPGSVVVRKRYDRLEFLQREAAEAESLEELTPVFVRFPGATRIESLGFVLTADICPVTDAALRERRRNLNRHEEWLDLDRVCPPLVVRGRRIGDRFTPLGNPGSKSLSDFLIDEKVDPQLRPRIGVLCDQAGPLWVIPLRIDERAKLRPTTIRGLRLALTPLVGGSDEKS
ncbi:MAG: tRNA lysidine(34) synthetase TilS [Phycisphaerales bacterium]|nr:tRNA lysidine(34) synthetase TilS [Phycisphaerales bacterium]